MNICFPIYFVNGWGCKKIFLDFLFVLMGILILNLFKYTGKKSDTKNYSIHVLHLHCTYIYTSHSGHQQDKYVGIIHNISLTPLQHQNIFDNSI